MTRRTLLLTVAVAATATAIAASPASAGVHATTVETVPVTVDGSNQSGWWNPLAVVGDETYFAYNVPAGIPNRHQVHLAVRSSDGEWTSGCLRDDLGGCVDYFNDNGHNQPSIAVDGDGNIHAFVSMHHEDWNYFRSTVPGDVTSLVEVSAEMPDGGGTISYPITSVGPDGDVWLMVRTGPDHLARRDGVLYHYDLDAGTWARETVIASATNFSVYPDDLIVDDDGLVHVLWEWHRWAAGPYRHLGSYAVWNPATQAFSDVAGSALPTPVRPDTEGAVVFQPFTGDESMTSTTPAFQTAKMAVQDGELAGIVYRYSTAGSTQFDLKWARWTGAEWVRETLAGPTSLGAGVDTIAAMDATAHGSKTRAYGVLTVPVCGVATSQVVMFESARGRTGWAVEAIGEPMTGQQRMRAAVGGDGDDVLYLSAPATAGGGTLRYAEVPRSGQKRTGGSLDTIVASMRSGECGS
ncbi:BNR-4 repeat-containing protein [Microbacterium sp.]|uniref:BNR-4 repeat-containing protein n=1 Tax=Microbacterium sp. TaxID=51671 RepID=UPI00281141B1|nr:BNR-4 repeat-containing protein [Microbacterium sp.]